MVADINIQNELLKKALAKCDGIHPTHAFDVSEECGRYYQLFSDDNEQIANLLICLTEHGKTLALRLSCLQLQNVNGHNCNQNGYTLPTAP